MSIIIYSELADISGSPDRYNYEWKQAYAEWGKEGLINMEPWPDNQELHTSPEIEEKIIYLRHLQ